MDNIKNDTLEVIKTLKDTEEYNQVLGEYQEVKKNFDSINERLEEIQEVKKNFDSINERLEEVQEVEEVGNLVEIQKYNFGINVLNSVLLICILIGIFLSKFD